MYIKSSRSSAHAGGGDGKTQNRKKHQRIFIKLLSSVVNLHTCHTQRHHFILSLDEHQQHQKQEQ